MAFKAFICAIIYNFICARYTVPSFVTFYFHCHCLGTKVNIYYYCSKIAAGIIILPFQKTTYLFLRRSFAATWQHCLVLWPRRIVHINLTKRELQLRWHRLGGGLRGILHWQVNAANYESLGCNTSQYQG
jgi:hypothetical protein